MRKAPLFVFALLLVTLAIAAPVAYMYAPMPFTNNPPSAGADSYTLHTNGVIGSVLINDFDPDLGNTIFPLQITSPTNGSLTYFGNGLFFYSRFSSTWFGTDSFTYKACDNQIPSLCSSAVTVTINVVNQTPVAVNDVYNVHGATQLGPYKANDSDPDGDAISNVQLTLPSHGTLQATAVVDKPLYTPNSGFVGTDSFTYKVCDTYNSCSSPATVFINVNDMSPIANADYFIVHGSAIIGPMFKNDYDPDGDTFAWTTTTVFPTHGNINGLPHPPYPVDYTQYVPNTNYTGEDSFVYQICDSLGACTTGTVHILVLPGSGPTIRVPYECAGCPLDPCPSAAFYPLQGGFPIGPGKVRSSGPASGDPVNLATGRESYFTEPDLSVYNPSGPRVFWQRAFLSDRALAEVEGYGSPGFTRGWVHNYDLKIDGTSGSWGALTLSYPNGATETLTPQLSSGVPTGSFTTPAGVPYVVTGVAGTPTGTWQSVTVTWSDQTKWKFTLLSGTTYALNQITNSLGLGLNFTWNSSRALTQVSDVSSSTTLLTLAYDSNGRITTATDAYNRQIAYTFDAGSSTTPAVLQTVSQMVTAGTSSPPAHFTYTYTSDKGQQLNTITVPSPTGTGNSTATINYNSIGKVSSVVDANGNQRVYTYNTGNTQVQVKDPSNNVVLSWSRNFDSSNRATGTTDAASHSTTLAYTDTANPLKPTSVTDRNGNVTTYTYDSFGNIQTVTTPRSVTTTYTWSYTNFALGRLTSVQEGTKPATTFTYYEPSGLVNTITRPEPNNGAGTTTTTLTYDSLGNVLTIVSPGNDATSTNTATLNYTTDGGYSQSAAIGQPLTITDNLSHVTHLRYDSQGRPTSITDAIGNESDLSYNLAGQLITTTYPATGQTGSGHSHATKAYLYLGGPLTSVTFYDESNTQVRQATRTYGAEGEFLSASGSTEPVTKTYDALYRIKTLKDANNNTTIYAYNSIGLVSSITAPGTEVTQFTSYDNNGNLLQMIDGNNVTTNYVYNDSQSFLTDVQYPATTSLNVHITYDGYGRRSGMTDGSGTQSYSYGNLNELLSTTTTYTGLSAKTISYTYYPDGSRESMTTPAGTFDYSYDAGGRLELMTNPFSETTSWTYKNNNRLESQTLDNGATATYTYNALGQVTRLLNEIASTTISDFSSISYDGAGNRSSVTASIPGTTSLDGTTSYTYDSKDQLTQETSTRNGGFTDNFSYDSGANPTSFKGVSKSYNSNNQQTGTGFSYDGNGNPTSYGGVTLTFDPANHMTAYGSILTAGYTGNGMRAWKQNSSGRTYFLYDGLLPIIEMNSSGAVTATNSFGAAGLVSRHETNSVFYSFDSEGNVTQRSDSSGSVMGSLYFSAHGATLGASLSDPFGHKAQFGYYTDNETGLQLLTYRYYDPASGRFLTQDPIGFRGGINVYAYVRNGAINASDPMGLWPDFIVGVSGSASANGGAGVTQAGASYQELYGVSINGSGAALGHSRSVGAFGNVRAPDGSGRDWEISYPDGLNSAQPGAARSMAFGASGGLGVGGFISNAGSFRDFQDEFHTRQLNLPFVSIDLDTGDNGTFVLSVSFGPSIGVSYADFYTNTSDCFILESPRVRAPLFLNWL
jgi:RHS repeat-associated protein